MCDHAKWASALGLKRIIHKIEANEQQGTECAPRRPCMSHLVPSQLHCLQNTGCSAWHSLYLSHECGSCMASLGLCTFWLALPSLSKA